MNNDKNKISVRLGILSLLFLAAAIASLIFQYSIEEHSKDVLDNMQQAAAQGSESMPDGVTSDAAASSATASGESHDDVTVAGTANSGSSASDADTDGNVSISEDAAPEPVPQTPNPYQDSFLANADMGAWLKIDGTVIDYPVMWTPRDETYYLYRNFEGREDQNGCLLLDTDSCTDPLTTNLIIHGHNMRSGAMFGSLTKYQDASYCREHSQITLYTETCERRYEVIAVFRSQVYKKTDQVFKFYKFFQADTEEAFDDFYQNIKALSLYDTGVTASFGDHFITLSTCTYHVQNGRFVVVAKEVEGGEQYAPFR